MATVETPLNTLEEPEEVEEEVEEEEEEEVGHHGLRPRVVYGSIGSRPPQPLPRKLISSSRPRGSGRRHQKPRNSNTMRTEDNYENNSLISAEIQQNQAYAGHATDDYRDSPSSDANNYEIPQLVPKKDKIFIVNAKRFIMSSLGVPGIPNVSKCTQTTISKNLATMLVKLTSILPLVCRSCWSAILLPSIHMGNHSLYLCE